MPLFFASNAIYPTDINARLAEDHFPSESVDTTSWMPCARSSLAGSTSTFGLGLDYAVILLTTTILVLLVRDCIPSGNVKRKLKRLTNT